MIVKINSKQMQVHFKQMNYNRKTLNKQQNFYVYIKKKKPKIKNFN